MLITKRQEELKRRLAQTRRLSREVADPTTIERLTQLIDELEEEKKREGEE